MAIRVWDYCDDIGPKAIVHVHEPRAGLKGIVVVDNVAAGPAIGGTRMAPDVSLDECFRLARAMTFKNAAAGLPHGGAKSVIYADPLMEQDRKERILRAFARAIRPISDYVPGPDMGTNENAMAIIKDEGGRCAGLPRALGGIPLDEIGATAYGVVASADVAMRRMGKTLEDARVAVQGFGAVGAHAARYFAKAGARVIGAADLSGAVYDKDGLDVAAMIAHKSEGGVASFAAGEHFERDAVIGFDCDILVPAARPDVIRADNEADVKATLIVPGANIGVTDDAERLLHERNVVCVPDFVANAGGVICAAVEFGGGTQSQVFPIIDEKIRANTEETLDRSERDGILPREAATQMARERLSAAMRYRRFL